MSIHRYFTQSFRSTVLFVLLIPLSSLAQEYDYDEIISSFEEGAVQTKPPQYGLGLKSSEFDNVAYNINGQMYTSSIYLVQKNMWTIGFDIPYIIGNNTGLKTQELGNLQLKTRFNAWQINSNLSLWIPFSVRIGQRGQRYLIASHHDTYRSGLDLDYVEGRISGSMGAGYQARVMEEDPKYDIGDIIDYRFLLRFAVSNRYSLQSVLQWYRVAATKIEGKEFGKDVDWASVAPGFVIHIVEGIDFMTSVVMPVIQTGTPVEADLAFGEVYYPQTSRVSLAWGLGANF